MLDTNAALSFHDNSLSQQRDLGSSDAPIDVDTRSVDEVVECHDNSTTTLSLDHQHDDPHFVSSLMITDRFSKINVCNRNTEKLQIIECYNRVIRNMEVSNNSITTTNDRSSIIEKRIEFVLINGETGIGKTTLVRSSIHDIVVKDGGYYMSGKFDENTSTGEPYSAFISAITEFCKTVISSGIPSEISTIQYSINNHIKTEHQILTDMIPLLGQILISTNNEHERTKVSTTPFMNNNNGSNLIHRFKYMFRMLMKAIQSMDKPIVFFLDDLHWADESSLDLLYSLLLDGGCNGILFIATYRIDDEQSMRFQKVLNNIRNSSSIIHLSIITLDHLSSNDVNVMLTEMMNLDNNNEVVKPLSDLIHYQTNGNICFVFEYLRFLTLRKLLFFDNESSKKWKWNIEDIRVATTKLSLDDFILYSIQDNISELTLHFIQCAVCLGTKLDLYILNHIVESDQPINVHIQLLASNGLIKFDTVDECWKFSHDVIKEAVYRTIDNRNEFHYRIGKRLWLQLSLEEIDKYIYVVVDQLLFGINDSIITKQQERNAIAKLCYRAGERSIELSHFHNAFDYLSIGISFLDKTSCWRNEYDFCLKLYNAASEVAHCIVNYNVANEHVNDILINARTLNDTIQAYCTKIFVLGSTGQLQNAVDIGLTILKKLDEPIPIRYTIIHILFEARRLKNITKKMKTDQDYLQLPRMYNEQKLLAMKIMNAIFSYSYMICPKLFMYLGLRLFHISLEYGQNAMTPAGFILYGLYIARVENVELGYRFGCLGMKSFEQYNIQQWTGRVYSLFYGFLHDLKMPMIDSIEPLKHAYTVSLEKGDIEYGFLIGNLILFTQLQLDPLDKLNSEIQSHIRQLNIFGQFHTLQMTKSMDVTVRNFLWNANPDMHNSQCSKFFIDENEYSNNQSPSETVLVWDLVLRMWLYYLFGHYDKAYEDAQVSMSSSVVNKGNRSSLPFALLFIGLTNIEYARKHDNCKLAIAKKCFKLIKEYARHAPSNSLGKKYLLEAELITFDKKKNKHVKSFEKYTAAIALSKDSGFLMETALGYERAAKELVRVGDYTRASTYFNEAINFYNQWGSKLKVKQLLQEIENYEIHQKCDFSHLK